MSPQKPRSHRKKTRGKTARVRRVRRHRRLKLFGRLQRERSLDLHDQQMRYLTRCRQMFLKRAYPVISVDTKNRELLSHPARPESVRRKVSARGHGEPGHPLYQHAIPYGIYDGQRNQGYLSIGISHDTPEFAVASIRAWWLDLGRQAYARRPHLLIQADSGGANGHRSWVWKARLQEFADECGLTITVNHFPPGTSRWNPIEARMFDLVRDRLLGEDPRHYAAVLKRLWTTRALTGFRCKVRLDKTFYPKGVKVSLKEVARLHLKPHAECPAWNYTIYPDGDKRRHLPSRELPTWFPGKYRRLLAIPRTACRGARTRTNPDLRLRKSRRQWKNSLLTGEGKEGVIIPNETRRIHGS